MNKQHRVLYVTNMWPTDENPMYGVFIQSQVDSLRQQGVDGSVLFIDGRARKMNYFDAIFSLRRALRSSNYDLIHAHYGLSGLVARAQRALPVVVSYCGDDLLANSYGHRGWSAFGSILPQLSKGLSQVVDAVIVKSHRMRSLLRRQDVHVVPNGVDFDRFDPVPRAEARSALGLEAGVKYVLFANDPALRVKRYDRAQEAISVLEQIGLPVQLLTLSRRPHHEVPLFMSACDALLVTSDSEGSPNTVKEAMACNLPVVSTDVGDVKEITEGTVGCHICDKDPVSLARGLRESLERGERTDGRRRLAHLKIENVAQRILSIYDQVLDQTASRTS